MVSTLVFSNLLQFALNTKPPLFCHFLGVGSEIVARVMEHETFYHLDAPVHRVTGKKLNPSIAFLFHRD